MSLIPRNIGLLAPRKSDRALITALTDHQQVGARELKPKQAQPRSAREREPRL